MKTIPQIGEPIGAQKSQLFHSLWLFLLLFLAASGVVLLILTIRSGLINLNPGRPNFDQYKVNPNHTTITSSDGHYWEIEYEKKVNTLFEGIVRHTSNIVVPDFPILTHDILVTTQDYSDPEKVTTSVTNHHFLWVSHSKKQLAGTINLLHTVPKNDEIYQLLAGIKSNDTVKISGWEIRRINAYTPDGALGLWWQDSGCNTLLVDFVEVIDEK